jgi:hypothetical protein
MNDNKLPHNWHDTDLYAPVPEDRIPLSAWFGMALMLCVFFLAFFL